MLLWRQPGLDCSLNWADALRVIMKLWPHERLGAGVMRMR
jgi:hypothetical protein